MKKVGIICEYNPFHSGHEYQIAKIREHYPDSAVIALMSGNYVQRGDIAVLPKYYRARAALLCGVDLVLELPYPFSGAGAQIFARAGVHILDSIGTDVICFGSESGDVGMLKKQSENIMSVDFETELRKALTAFRNSSVSYAAVRSGVYEKLFNSPILQQPNDILAVEYLIALKKSSSAMEPFVVGRKSGFSATAARKAYIDRNYDVLRTLVPEKSFEILKDTKPVKLESMEKAILARFRTARKNDFDGICDSTPDMINRMLESARLSSDITDFFRLCATKKYTNARIRRAAISCMLGTQREMLALPPLFTRLLAANKTGRRLLEGTAFPVMLREGRRGAYDSDVRKQMEFADKAELFFELADENARIKRPLVI